MTAPVPERFIGLAAAATAHVFLGELTRGDLAERMCAPMLADLRRQVAQQTAEAKAQQIINGDPSGDWSQRLAWHIWQATIDAYGEFELMLDGIEVADL